MIIFGSRRSGPLRKTLYPALARPTCRDYEQGGIFTKKRIVFSTLAVALVAVLAALVVVSVRTSVGGGEVVLNYAEVNSLDGTISGELAKAFKARVEELSGGEITVVIHAGGVLGSDDQVLDNMLGGGNMTDLARVSALALTQYGCRKASLLALPYTFENVDQFVGFCNSDLAQEFLEEPVQIGLPIRGLCYAEEGFRHFFFSKPVESIEGFRGKKIRISSDPVMIGMVDGLGGSATNVSFTELYSALSTGVVDGAEQPLANYYANAFYEVAPHVILDAHTLGIIQIVISEYRWQHLTEQQRQWVSQAAAEAAEIAMAKVSEIEQSTIDALQEANVSFYSVDDFGPWKEAVEGVVKQQVGEDLADLYSMLQSFGTAGEEAVSP